MDVAAFAATLAAILVAMSFGNIRSRAQAQTQVQIYGNVILPRTSGASVLSTYINAVANRINAQGEYLKSAAAARQINLESDRIAMENSMIWVETYFERKKLNREYRDELRKDYQERKTSIALAYHKRIQFGDTVADPVEELNYMLNTLMGNQNSFAALFVADESVMKSRDMELTPDDVAGIRMNAGSGNTFTLSKPILVDSIWPKVFDPSEFDAIRSRYDYIRLQTQNEIKNGNLTLKTFEELNRTLAELAEIFERYYTWDRVKELKTMDLAGLVYVKETGHRFVQNQRAGALLAFSAKDPSAYQLGFQFDGDTLTDLLRYCSTHNVKFASAPAAKTDLYARLYQSLRVIYLEFITDVDPLLR